MRPPVPSPVGCPVTDLALAVIGIADLVAVVRAWVAGGAPPARILPTA